VDLRDGLLGKVPVVTILVAIVMTIMFVVPLLRGSAGGGEYEKLVLGAQVFYERNPGVTVSARGRSLLGEDFVERVAAEHAASLEAPVFSKRMRDRTQSKFDALCNDAWAVRMVEDPAWSQGISGPDVPITRYLTYAFFHDGWLAFAITLAFLLIVGLGLETTWGALVHAPLVLLSIFAGGLVFAYADAAGQIPLTGGGPLVAALLGAYVVRGIGGKLPLPGALLLPAWLFIDALFARGIWIENLGDWPILTLGLCIALGAGLAAGVRLMGVDAALVDKVDSLADGVHPALEAAERFRNLGRPADVFDTLAAAAVEEPSNRELILAWWDAAIEIGRADEVAHAIVPVLQAELRAGDVESATTHWRQVMASGASVQASTTLLVRMGEALLDAGEPEQALDTLRRSIDAPGTMGSALAQRIVRIARDLDPVLTSRAAELALRDPQIDAETRADLVSLAGGGAASAATWSGSDAAPSAAADAGPAQGSDSVDDLLGGAPAGVAPAAPASGGADTLDAGLGEADPVGSDDLGLDGDVGDGEIDLSHVGDLASPDDFAALDSGAEGLPSLDLDAPGGSQAPPPETDPNALSLQSIEREFASGLETDTPAAQVTADPEAWNDPGRVEDLSGELDGTGPALMTEGDLDEPAVDDAYLDPGALSADALSSEVSAGELDLAPPGSSDFSGDATDPMTMPDDLDTDPDESTDALPPLGASAEEPAPETPPTEPLLDRGSMDAQVEQAQRAAVADAESPAAPTLESAPAVPEPLAAAASVDAPVPPPPAPVAPPMPPPPAAVAPPAAMPPVVAPVPAPAAGATTRVDDLETAAGPGSALRALKVLDAVPLALEADALKFDVEGRGKTRLPFTRIDAVSVAAVSSLSAKPVLVIDFVLNWGGGADDPLKVIRVRSDGFSPVALVGAGDSPLEAIKTLIRRVLDGAQAMPLPDVGAVVGSPFSAQPDLATYEREVLQAG